jgi:hypothetical protein
MACVGVASRGFATRGRRLPSRACGPWGCARPGCARVSTPDTVCWGDGSMKCAPYTGGKCMNPRRAAFARIRRSRLPCESRHVARVRGLTIDSTSMLSSRAVGHRCYRACVPRPRASSASARALRRRALPLAGSGASAELVARCDGSSPALSVHDTEVCPSRGARRSRRRAGSAGGADEGSARQGLHRARSSITRGCVPARWRSKWCGAPRLIQSSRGKLQTCSTRRAPAATRVARFEAKRRPRR